jgi:hypothetical protein
MQLQGTGTPTRRANLAQNSGLDNQSVRDDLSMNSLSLSRQSNDNEALSPSPVHRRRYFDLQNRL